MQGRILPVFHSFLRRRVFTMSNFGKTFRHLDIEIKNLILNFIETQTNFRIIDLVKDHVSFDKNKLNTFCNKVDI